MTFVQNIVIILCILPLRGRPRVWPKRVGGHSVYNYFQYIVSILLVPFLYLID